VVNSRFNLWLLSGILGDAGEEMRGVAEKRDATGSVGKRDDDFAGDEGGAKVKPIDPFHAIVKFGDKIPGKVQGVALLEFERALRRLMPEAWPEVFKDVMGDDSKLRALMTPEARKKL
jgi:hypothetical protein